jgi:hypothetical protein
MQGGGGVLGISVVDFPFTACKGISLGVTSRENGLSED